MNKISVAVKEFYDLKSAAHFLWSLSLKQQLCFLKIKEKHAEVFISKKHETKILKITYF